MQQNPEYHNLHEEIYDFLDKKSDDIGKLNGGKIIIDPGFGFGKSINHNFTLLRDLLDFTFIQKPILVGLSRKSFIGKILGVDSPSDRIEGTAATVAISIANGADIIRVHDVRQMARVCRMSDAIIRSK